MTVTALEVEGKYLGNNGQRIALTPDGLAEMSESLYVPPSDDDYSLTKITWSMDSIDGGSVVIRFHYNMGAMEHRYRSYMPKDTTEVLNCRINESQNGDISIGFEEHGWFTKLPTISKVIPISDAVLESMPTTSHATLPQAAKGPDSIDEALGFDLSYPSHLGVSPPVTPVVGHVEIPPIQNGQIRGRFQNDRGESIAVNDDGSAELPTDWVDGRVADDYDYDGATWSHSSYDDTITFVLRYSIGAMEHRYVSYLPREESVLITGGVERISETAYRIRTIDDVQYVQID